jgi:SNF2 family DNA or RNA helicase
MNFQKIEEHYKKVSYHKQHPELTLQEWQYALRMKFAEKSFFGIEKLDGHYVFSDYLVKNTETNNTYKVSIRDNDNSMNFCSCYDFKTNHLGTCKHIESVLLKIKNNKNKVKALEKNYQPPYSSIYVDYRNGRTIKFRLGTDNKIEFDSFTKKYFDNNNQLKAEYFPDFYSILKEAMQVSPELKCYPDVISLIVEQVENEKRIRKLDAMYSNNSEVFNDQLITANLFPYQQQGVVFAAKAGRCLIADDMGLGKTIQAIAASELLKREVGVEKVLIVCPTSLKYQWKAEIEKFTKSSVLVIEGSPDKRPDQYNSDHLYCIVSYHTAANDIEIIEKLRPDLTILDEAQRIKNFRAKTSQKIKKIPSDYAIVLTGTPLENKLEELYSIIQFIDPFVLGPYHEFMANHQVKNENGKIIGYQNLHQIGKKLSHLMIRRTKKEVLSQLPKRMDKVLLVPMTKTQAEWHEEYKSVVAKLVHKWQRLGFLPEKDRQRLMINMNMMRMVCDSTYIIDQKSRNDTKVEELMSIIEEIDAEGSEKVVVFSQWERMTRLVAAELDKKGIKYDYLHGGIPSVKREALFTNFNNDAEVKVFLSTDAGGVGLNLQAASYLINVDIPWNPAVLEQRIGRIHRLGQKKNVSITNMVSVGTIEHRMLDVLSFKSSLAEGILDGGEDAIFMGESKFNKFMETIDDMVQVDEKTELETVDGFENVQFNEINDDKIIAGKTDKEPITKTKSELEQEPEADTVFEEETITQRETVEPEENILTTGIKLLGRLSETLADKEATKKMVESVIEKDKETGKNLLENSS